MSSQARPQPKIEDIKEAIAYVDRVAVSEVTRDTRIKEVTFLRHTAMYLSKVLTDASLRTIARKTGRTNHSTVLHAYKRKKFDYEHYNATRTFINDVYHRLHYLGFSIEPADRETIAQKNERFGIMSNRNRTAGNNFELDVVKRVKERGWKATTTRFSSHKLDYNAVDIDTDFPWMIQCKSTVNTPNMDGILNDDNKEANVVFWRKMEKRGERFYRIDEFAMLRMEDFMDLVDKAHKKE